MFQQTLCQQLEQQGAGALESAAAAAAAAAAAPAAAADDEEARVIQQLEACRSYEECKQLFAAALLRAAATPRIVAAAALRLAIWGSREFKEQQQQQQQHQMLQKPDKANSANAARTEIPFMQYQFDERFMDFKQRMRLALQRLLQELQQQQQSSAAAVCCAADGLAAAALSRVCSMEEVRVLAFPLRGALQTLNPKPLIRVLHNYTKCMQRDADAKGGINITAEDRDFTEKLLQELLRCSEGFAQTLNPRRETLKTLNPRDITLLLKACDRLSLQNPNLMQQIGQRALAQQNSFSVEDWASVIAVFSRMGFPLRGDCSKQKRPQQGRDWSRPPPPKKPVPISQC
ncbi:hypothetical protein, conserved [Eimeria tenella]|uniref:Uncharacterized protein n=1 Tax=Eimeria tenella TaxID=5802 RepID=U6L3Z3_EIMTE|nr:hypothetical protein, conserved [Eimeria tenella]CDJ44891.1 hypothetical protein, conserved [Eimeria tenella]|eukprot:XP_013235638.1 hypothetical protein, conserved [Eimeria tenella]